MQLVLASNNLKKLTELQDLLAPLPIELVAQQALGVQEVEEPYLTFIENALTKARHASACAHAPALADDSGLCVNALLGSPGVASAHFATINMNPALDREANRRLQDAANNQLLLEKLQGASDRRAYYVSTFVAVRSCNDPEPLVAVGRWHGEILLTPKGTGGFGYDPLMWIPALDQTAAELAPEIKNAHSHRAVAARHLLQLIREAWHLG